MLKKRIAEKLDEMTYSPDYILSMADLGLLWRPIFEPDSFEQHLTYVLSSDKRPTFTIFAGANLAIGAPPGEYKEPEKKVDTDKPPPGLAKQIRAIDAHLKKVRAQEHRPRDLPDRLVHYPHRGGWWMNVWVHLGPTEKEKFHKAIELKDGESTDDLYERVLQATQEALEATRAAERRKREYEMPAWAMKLKRELDQRLDQESGGRKAEDVPDGMTLAFESEGAQTPGPMETPYKRDTAREPRVMLQVWVQRRKGVERNFGSVPIAPETTVEMLVPYVRRLAAILRQFESVPQGTVVATKLDPNQPLMPFAAMLSPRDLQPDNVTVEDAKNKFTMDLDFAERYRAQPNDDLYIASKLYNQAIFFYWKVYPVPSDLQPEPEEKIPSAWGPKRWALLYKRYNGDASIGPGGIHRTIPTGKVQPPSTTPVWESKEDITTRVSLKGPPGEYLVYCETRHAKIGDEKLNRASSIAYYPVLTKSKEAITYPLVSQTEVAMQEAQARLKQITELEGGKDKELDDNQKKVLSEARASTERQISVLDTKEKRDLVATTTAEIADGTERLKLAKRLAEVLPGIIEEAKQNATNNVEPQAPSKLLLAKDAQLVPLYWQLIHENKSASGYVKSSSSSSPSSERCVRARSNSRTNSSPTHREHASTAPKRSSSPSSTVISTRWSSWLANRVAGFPRPYKVGYTVADVTTSQTQKRYKGYSAESGAEGHREAIDEAFEDFGDQATYGEGWIAVRMPPGPHEQCKDRRTSGIKLYRSKEGILEKVWKALGFIALVIGMAALVATGFGAPFAGLLGAAAGILGAVQAIHNISERQARHRLEADAALAMDIIAILGVGQIAVGARIATLPNTIRGFQTAQRLGRYLALYNLGTEGATAILIPLQLRDDLDRIDNLKIPEAEKDKLKHEAVGGAISSGVMFLAASAGARVMARTKTSGMPLEEDYTAIRQKAELMAMEEGSNYKSFQDKGWVDADGNWTSEAPDVIRKAVGETVPTTTSRATKAPAKPRVGTVEPEARQQAAAAEGVKKIDEGQATTSGEPGHRVAEVGEGHKVVEVEGPKGVTCEFHSTPIPVDCPVSWKKDPAHAPGEPPKAQQPRVAAADEPPRELLPQDLISARQQERGALTRKANIDKQHRENVKAIEKLEETEIPRAKARVENYRRKNPKAGADDPELKKLNDELELKEKSLETLDDLVAKQEKHLEQIDNDLAQIESLKKQYEGSKPWRQVDLQESDNSRVGLYGELEMSLTMQGEGFEPIGTTVRADKIVIPQDFDTAVSNWRGKTGIDGIYRRRNPNKPTEWEYWVGESKTTGDPNAKAPTGKGALKPMETGELQLSDKWISERLDRSGLSDLEVKEIRAAMAEGRLKKFYAQTDSNGTRLYEVNNPKGESAYTSVVIGPPAKF